MASVGSAPDSDGLLVYNGGSVTVYLGGTSSVTTTTGYPLPASTSVNVPTTGSEPLSLYGITASSTATVSVLYPS
ncbi:MAG TPA: hypothetical protein VEI45_09200 [Mycobacterium sp.]|uniref:hypothetical protein n=1 Tax=Mycobacterium sp. TaxID=1785 RepID=UPI002D30663D|nr:hypothetical protein [Mycobacterium sp.]HXY64505.1 hypothetical protein [Mycobacterium sp.]